jgi:hypothetical protein
MEVSGQRHVPSALPRERDPGTHFTGGWVGTTTSRTGAENLAPTGIRSPTIQPVASRYTEYAILARCWVGSGS